MKTFVFSVLFVVTSMCLYLTATEEQSEHQRERKEEGKNLKREEKESEDEGVYTERKAMKWKENSQRRESKSVKNKRF